MTVEEAIKTAIEYETRIRDLYLEALEAATDENGKRIFKLMADEEQHHLNYLNTKLTKLEASGEIDIDDVVYLINYIFTGGQPPCALC